MSCLNTLKHFGFRVHAILNLSIAFMMHNLRRELDLSMTLEQCSVPANAVIDVVPNDANRSQSVRWYFLDIQKPSSLHIFLAN
jgi:hypothetical protein